MLYSYVSAHNAYVTAMAASQKAGGADSPNDSMAPLLNAPPPSNRKRQGPFHVDKDGSARGAASSDGSVDASRGQGARTSARGRVGDDKGSEDVDDYAGAVHAGGVVGAVGNIGAGGDVGGGGDTGGVGDVCGGRDVGANRAASTSVAAGAGGTAGAVAAVGGDGDGDGVSEDVNGGLACDFKRLVTARRTAFMRRKKAAPVVSSGRQLMLGLPRVLTKRH